MGQTWGDAIRSGYAVFGVITAILLLEACLSRRGHPSTPRWRLAHNGSLFVAARVLGWALVAASAWVFEPGDTPPDAWAGWLHFGAILLLLDAVLYATHRLSHRMTLLWRMHRLHHTDTMLDVSTNWRHHPGELLWVGTVTGGLAGMAGALPIEIATYALLAETVQSIAHSDLPVPNNRMGWLSWLIVTPAQHHVHHAPNQDATDTNYGQVLSVWDRLFGTFNPRPNVAKVFGLTD